MDFFDSLTAARVIFILGAFNIVMALLIFLSCRCFPGIKIAGRLMRYQPYRRFFGYHCYFWIVFWLSVIVHAFFALMFYGWPG